MVSPFRPIKYKQRIILDETKINYPNGEQQQLSKNFLIKDWVVVNIDPFSAFQGFIIELIPTREKLSLTNGRIKWIPISDFTLVRSLNPDTMFPTTIPYN